MATVLLIVIFISFIGLGVPDSLLGTAWPAMYKEFQTGISGAGYISMTVSICTFISSLVSARVINRFGVGKVTAVSALMTAVGILGYVAAPHIAWLYPIAVVLGLGAGTVDSALNNYVAIHYKASHMNFLHCFYGVGVSLSPYIMSFALKNGSWRDGYLYAFCVQITIAVIAFLALPLWKKVGEKTADDSITPQRTASIKEIAGIPVARMAWLIFFTACAIEFTAGIWGSTFLVNSRGMTADAAAIAVTLYYAGLALGRFTSGVCSNKLTSWQLIGFGYAAVFAAIVIIALPLPYYFAAAGLFLAGFGIGPVYPNMVHLTPKNFGEEISQSVMGTQAAAASLGIMLMPSLFGTLAQAVGTGILPYYLIAVYAVMLAATVNILRLLKK